MYISFISLAILGLYFVLLTVAPRLATYFSPFLILLVPGVQLFSFYHKSKSIYGALARILFLSTIVLFTFSFILFYSAVVSSFWWHLLFISWIVVVALYEWWRKGFCSVGKHLREGSRTIQQFCSALNTRSQAISGKLVGQIVLILVLSLIVLVFASIMIVPPLLDQDFETEATAWGLMHDWIPLCVNDRSLIYFYAHPLLFHYYIGFNALNQDRLDDFKEYYEISKRCKRKLKRLSKRLEGSEFEQAKPGTVKKDLFFMIQHFNSNPDKRISRSLSIFFALVMLIILFLSMVRDGQANTLALLLIVFLLTTPEFVVRASYGGYMAISCCFLTLALVLQGSDPGHRKERVAVGILAALANHKLAFHYLGTVVFSILRAGKKLVGGSFNRMRAAGLFPWGMLGFGCGTLLFWLYGFVTNKDAFYIDHLRIHILNRVGAEDLFHYTGYLSSVGVWIEFFQHQGYVLLILWMYALIAGFKRYGLRYGGVVIPLLLGIILFTLTDWRQTKHLMLLLPYIFVFYPIPAQRSGRVILSVICITGIARNIFVLVKLAQDFSYISPTPLW